MERWHGLWKEHWTWSQKIWIWDQVLPFTLGKTLNVSYRNFSVSRSVTEEMVPDVVAHLCNPSYQEGWGWKILSLRVLNCSEWYQSLILTKFSIDMVSLWEGTEKGGATSYLRGWQIGPKWSRSKFPCDFRSGMNQPLPPHVQPGQARETQPWKKGERDNNIATFWKGLLWGLKEKLHIKFVCNPKMI